MNKLRTPIARAVRMLSAHPGCHDVSKAGPGPGGGTELTVTFHVELPFDWRAQGQSPSGVRALEPVSFRFNGNYPRSAPVLRLRQDFDRSLAHFQPGPPDEPPILCIVDGSLEEFHAQRGLLAVVDQLLDWLEKAALDQLIDQKQGWEPVRRDNLPHELILDLDAVRSHVTPAGGHALLKFRYLRGGVEGETYYLGSLGSNRMPLGLDPDSMNNAFRQEGQLGVSVALLVWPGNSRSGKPTICETYAPETVVYLGSLRERAQLFGCKKELETGLRGLHQRFSGAKSGPITPFAVLLVARRPFHLIGSTSDLEISPYVMELEFPDPLDEEQLPVKPALHRHAISPALLSRLSGMEAPSLASWLLAGCGSLGSKVGMHLARAGQAPAKVIDQRFLSPHNAARHALIPSEDVFSSTWIKTKASAFAEAVRSLRQSTTVIEDDVRSHIGTKQAQRRFVPKGSQFLFNATASVAVREALAAAPRFGILPRIVEGQLYARGAIGLLTVEGPERSPDTGALTSEAYERLRRGSGTRQVFDNAQDWQEVGQGCGSATMVIPDSRISLFAASMGEQLLRFHRGGLPKGGLVLIGSLAPDGISLQWVSHQVEKISVFSPEGRHDWKVHVLPRAHRKILEETARHPTVETGGIILGRFSEAVQAFYVTDVLAAPPDSRRSVTYFELGVKGVKEMLAAYVDSAGGSLYCLGTWHSHLADFGPSSLDQRTAQAQGLARLMPSVLLIRTPARYRAVLAAVEG